RIAYHPRNGSNQGLLFLVKISKAFQCLYELSELPWSSSPLFQHNTSMKNLKITKKHHIHLNNPFPSPPTSSPLVQGDLSANFQALPPYRVFSIGQDFQLLWRSENGGSLSIHHLSQPTRSIWSTIPGRAFVSAAMVETEVEESRGSFAVKDGAIRLVCNHQTIDDIKEINGCDYELEVRDHHFPSGYLDLDQKSHKKDAQFPIMLLITWQNIQYQEEETTTVFKKLVSNVPPASARIWVLFDRKNSSQIGFQVMLGQPSYEYHSRGRLTGLRKGKFEWHWSLAKLKGCVRVSSSRRGKRRLESTRGYFEAFNTEKEEILWVLESSSLTWTSRGKRVPILVQEQGIGRGDQPITFAANLVSYRAGGDWSTTYAPSPFYITSRMRSLYLEGYEYSVFDLTKNDMVQIQIYGNSIQGRILHGNSPSELIERFTETIGRPPELPGWIISGAVVGMQGGTDAVRQIWDVLKAHEVPISAFWLQHIKVMTYCNPCLAPVSLFFNTSKSEILLIRSRNRRQRNLYEEAKGLGDLGKEEMENPTWFPTQLLMWECWILRTQITFQLVQGKSTEMVMMEFRTIISGEDPITAHNRYPEMWAQINREFADE
ncbi:yihQ, partial [Cucurbita argyrosperma subsp. argyrosperma]